MFFRSETTTYYIILKPGKPQISVQTKVPEKIQTQDWLKLWKGLIHDFQPCKFCEINTQRRLKLLKVLEKWKTFKTEERQLASKWVMPCPFTEAICKK